jgi:hypothetical protein
MEITMLFSIVFVRKTDSKVSLQKEFMPQRTKRKHFCFLEPAISSDIRQKEEYAEYIENRTKEY